MDNNVGTLPRLGVWLEAVKLDQTFKDFSIIFVEKSQCNEHGWEFCNWYTLRKWKQLHLVVIFYDFVFLDALIDPSEVNDLPVLLVNNVSYTQLFPYLLTHTVFSDYIMSWARYHLTTVLNDCSVHVLDDFFSVSKFPERCRDHLIRSFLSVKFIPDSKSHILKQASLDYVPFFASFKLIRLTLLHKLRQVPFFTHYGSWSETVFEPFLSNNLHVVWVADDFCGCLRLLELFIVILNGLALKQLYFLFQLSGVNTRNDVRGERRSYLVCDCRAH